jgi:hypothetical protein
MRGRAWFAAAAVAVTLALAAGTARADADDPFARGRTELGLGMLAGGFSVGPVAGPAVGIHLDAGRRMGPLFLVGEYNLLSIGEGSQVDARPIRGLLHRVGASARYSVVEFGGGRHIPVQGGVWIEGGVGAQEVRWDGGGRLGRGDVNLGFGLQTNVRLRRNRPDERFLGFYYAFRATAARAPELGKREPTCAGPCDEPTLPSALDLGLLFNFGVVFGR